MIGSNSKFQQEKVKIYLDSKVYNDILTMGGRFVIKLENLKGFSSPILYDFTGLVGRKMSLLFFTEVGLWPIPEKSMKSTKVKF